MFMFYWFNGDTGNTMASDSCTACRDCCNCCCASGRTGPMYVYDPCLGCDGCCNACYCGECCSQGTAAGGTSCAECCTASTMGEECLAVMALACVVLAVVGLFVSVFAGLVYANRSIQRHIHIVSKMTMTEDLVVKDLAPGAVELPSCVSVEPTQYNDIETGFLMTSTTHAVRRDD